MDFPIIFWNHRLFGRLFKKVFSHSGRKYKLREIHNPNGMHPDKTFYIVWRDDPSTGIASNIIVLLGQLLYADTMGYTPVVDMKTYKNSLVSTSNVGALNGWEIFFEQPCGFSLEDAYSGKNILIDGCIDGGKVHHPDIETHNHSPKELLKWRKLFMKYIRFNREMEKYIEDKFIELFPKGEKILGVKLRGTDYVKKRPCGHPVQPDLPTALAECKKVLKERSCGRIFLATEDRGIRGGFMSDPELKDKIITLKHDTLFDPDTGKKYVAELIKDDQAVLTDTARNYLTEMALLSKCDCFLAGQTSGSTLAALMSPGFEYACYFDLGKYGIDEKCAASAR